MCRRCGDWTVHGEGVESLLLCASCRGEISSLANEQRIRYEVEGKTFLTPPNKPPKAKRRTEGVVNYHRLWNRARSRAVVRLIQIYKPMFEVLMAEEKERVGLNGGYDSHGIRDAEVTRKVVEQAESADFQQP